MADYTKHSFARNLNTVAVTRAQDATQAAGKTIPCSVVAVLGSGIVTVKFEVNAGAATLPHVTIPVAYPEYIRYPIQVGDKGMAVPGGVKTGGLTGLGSGVPDLSNPGNLSAMSFMWLGSSAWSATDDANAVVIYGPDGVKLRNTASTHYLAVNSTEVNIDGNIQIKPTQIGFFGGSPVSKETITGALSAVTDGNAKAVLTSIIAALTGYNLATNGTT